MDVEQDTETNDDGGQSGPASAGEGRRGLAQLSRRRFLHGAGLVGAGALAMAGFSESGLLPGLSTRTASVSSSSPTATSSASPSSSSAPQPPDRTFVTTHLTTPHVTSWSTAATAPGLLFAGPMGHGSNGLIMNDAGEPVWMEPTGAGVMDLRVQTFEGQPVLTYWTGQGIGGHGLGKGVIMDSSYRQIAEVDTGNGMQADLHEFTLTSAGTALLTSYPTIQHDLSSMGGSAKGYMYNCHVQEVDVRSGEVLLDWNALDHIPLTDSYIRPSDPSTGDSSVGDGSTAAKGYDPYHINSVDVWGADALLISSRHTHTLYLVDRKTGSVRWRMGGKHSDFSLGPNATFAWQHDARWQPNGLISMFDNHYDSGNTGNSRGLVLAVDEQAKTAVVKQEFTHAGHRGNAMGSVQFLDNGHVMVGWGSDPAATEFTADGTAIYEATRIGTASYRAYRSAWVGKPDTVPVVAGVPGNGSTMQVYASWNGATEVAKWRFLTGASADSLAEAGTFPKRGFETSTAIAAAPHLAVQALDKSGAVLGTSVTIAT
jgi:hypothetical protein